MHYAENGKLFTVKDVTHACGISRATLLRMEESGYLTPCYTDPETGYRYYNSQNIAAVGQYQMLHAIGFSRKDIADLYYERVDRKNFIKEQKKKLETLQRFLNDYEIRGDSSYDRTFSYLSLPESTCYCTEIEADTGEDAETLSFQAHQKCVSEGYRLLGCEPLMTILPDKSPQKESRKKYFHYILCIPVLPGPDAERDPNLRTFPAIEGFSIVGYGDYDIIPGLMKSLYEETQARGHQITGMPRVIGLAAPYVSPFIQSYQYCFRCVLPIDSK